MADFASIFFADKPDDPQYSYSALQMRRKIAEQIAGRRAQLYPKNIGEGIFSAADSFADAYGQKSLENRLAAYEKWREGDAVQNAAGQSSVVPLPTAKPVRPPASPRRRADLDPYTWSAGANMTPTAGAPPTAMSEMFAQDALNRPEDLTYYG